MSVKRGKERHYIIIKEIIQHEDVKTVNIYMPIWRSPQYIKHLLTNIKEVIDSNIITVGPLTPHLQ